MEPNPVTLRERVRRVVFEADTPAGRAFDIALIAFIVASVLVVMLDSVRGFRETYGGAFHAAELFFTVVFTIEYLVRIWCAPKRWEYVGSFYGVIDLLAILPTYINFLLPGTRFLLVIRVLRVLRVFRILKSVRYVREANTLIAALRASRSKIGVFLFTVMTLVVVLGSIMYLIEGEENGFTSIPMSIYWCIVTLTTVGYGDISPATPAGKAVASLVMIVGYGIIAVPTGIVTVSLTQATRDWAKRRSCPACGTAGHDMDALFCKRCGRSLDGM